MRILTRRLGNEQWQFSKPVWNINDRGVGHAVYSAAGPDNTYSLVAFAHELPDHLRSDRVIAEAWDTTFCLFDGIPTAADIERLAAHVPVQEAGRLSEKELTLSRANRSVRLWSHVVDALAAGRQPDAEQLNAVGYLMRTTAVYGSGKFGAADRESFANRPELQAPFQAEMLSVYLIRTFVRDLVEHMAAAAGGERATRLDPALARQLGIGNSTGLGMAPFIVNHPVLFNNWIAAREEALARVCQIEYATATEHQCLVDMVHRASDSVGRWKTTDPSQQKKIVVLQDDLHGLKIHVAELATGTAFPWQHLVTWAQEQLSLEAQELLASLLMEPYGHLVDDLADTLSDADELNRPIDGTWTVGEAKAQLVSTFDWALEMDWQAPQNIARAWYVSAEKLEPRLGERFAEPIVDYEQPLAPARDAKAAHAALADWPEPSFIAEFLLHHPEHRHTIRRAQLTQHAPYSEIRDNTISADLLPIDMLRAKLAFFGANHFDPRSDRWLRICMYAGAPYPDELTDHDVDRWVYPTV